MRARKDDEIVKAEMALIIGLLEKAGPAGMSRDEMVEASPWENTPEVNAMVRNRLQTMKSRCMLHCARWELRDCGAQKLPNMVQVWCAGEGKNQPRWRADDQVKAQRKLAQRRARERAKRLAEQQHKAAVAKLKRTQRRNLPPDTLCENLLQEYHCIRRNIKDVMELRTQSEISRLIKQARGNGATRLVLAGKVVWNRALEAA